MSANISIASLTEADQVFYSVPVKTEETKEVPRLPSLLKYLKTCKTAFSKQDITQNPATILSPIEVKTHVQKKRLGKAKTGRKIQACTACRSWRKKCDLGCGNFPCSTCVKYNKICRPAAE